MAGLHAEILGDRVDTTIDSRLLRNSGTFVVDNDRLGESLGSIGVADSVIDSMSLKFKRARGVADFYLKVDYKPLDHEIRVGMSGKRVDYERGGVGGAWSGHAYTQALIANYGIAREAHVLKEHAEKHPDAVTTTSTSNTYNSYRRGSLLLGTSLALAIGGSYATGSPDGALIGAGSGIVINTAGNLAYNSISESEKLRAEEYNNAQQNMDKRAREFALSPEGFELFNGIVQVEFLK